MGKRKAPRRTKETGEEGDSRDSTYAQCLSDLSHLDPVQRHGACSLLGNVFLANSSRSAAAVVARFATADMLARLHTRLQDSDRNVSLEAVRAVRNAFLSESATLRLLEYGFLNTVCTLLRSRLVGMLADQLGSDFMDTMLCEQLLLCIVNFVTNSESGVGMIIGNKMCTPLVGGLLGFTQGALLATRMLCAEVLFISTDSSPGMCEELTKQQNLTMRLTELALQQHSSRPDALIGLRAAGTLLHLSLYGSDGLVAGSGKRSLVDSLTAYSERALAALALDSGEAEADGGVSCEYYSKLSHWYLLDAVKVSCEVLTNSCLESGGGNADHAELPRRLLEQLASSLEGVSSFLRRNESSLRYEALTASQACIVSLGSSLGTVAGMAQRPLLRLLAPRLVGSVAELLDVFREDADPLKMALLGALLVLLEQAGELEAPEQLLQLLCEGVRKDAPAVAALAAETLSALSAGRLLQATSEALLTRAESLCSSSSPPSAPLGGVKARLLAALTEAFLDLHSGDGDEALALYLSTGAATILARARVALSAQQAEAADILGRFLRYKEAFLEARIDGGDDCKTNSNHSNKKREKEKKGR